MHTPPQDIVFHIVWVLCWFIASVDWAVAFNRLKNYVRDYFEDLEHYDCLGSEFPAMDVEEDTGLYVQAAIAVVRHCVVSVSGSGFHYDVMQWCCMALPQTPGHVYLS